MNNRYILATTLLLTTLIVGGSATAQVTVKGNVFGGGNQADVQINTAVNISAGQVEGNVYGGGNLGDVGTIDDKTDKANYDWTGTDNQPNSSGGANNTGVCSVSITGATVLIGLAEENAAAEKKDHGNVFGGGKGDDNSGFYCEKGMVYSTSVEITAGTVKGTVFGGGEVGRVEDNTIVEIGVAGASREGEEDPSPVINGDVFGAGKGLKTHGYSALVRGNPVVTIQGKALVGGSVYGGGEIASVGKHKVKTGNNTPEDAPADLPVGMPYTLANTNLGICTVTIKDNVIITNNVFGAGQGIDDYVYSDTFRRMGMSGWDEPFANADAYHVFLQTLALATDTHVTIDGNVNINGSVYGGSESGFVQYDTNVTIKGGVIGVDVYGGDVYGGGRGLTNNVIAGRVNGNINVNILGGTITRDVYGGAALAKSNTKSTTTTGENPTTTYPTTTVNLLGGTIGRDAYGGGLGDASTAADVGNTKVNLNGLAVSEYNANTTLYSSYVTAIDNDTPTDDTDYYMVNTDSKGCIVNRIFGANNANGTPLGDVTVHVYATQNKSASKTTIGAKLGKDDESLVQGESEGDADYLARLKDILRDKIAIASPFNDIDVSSYNETFFTETNPNTFKTAVETITTALDAKAETEAGQTAINAVRYDMEAVYGGGNEAAYIPTTAWNGTTGSKSQVIIDGCDYTSIEYVYGGGNAAAVPETNVTVNAAYEIYNVFGGGNGKDNLLSGDPNPGADVGVYKNGSTEVLYGTGNTTTRLIGGTIHEAYGASNTKGTIKGTIDIDTGTDGYCPLLLDKMVGAGKNADIDGGVNIIMGCKPSSKIAEVYGGADNANVNGDISLTITSGNFGKVFGGNNLGGAVKGSITLNIEETGECETPITIDELYLGGNQAAYSVYGYKEVTRQDPAYLNDNTKTITVLEPRTSMSDNEGTAVGQPENIAQDATQWYADPVLNVISCTSIGKVFGGGLGEGAIMYANPTVNLNMIPGSKALDELGAADKLGVIGDVFGGGNEAEVVGNTTVNIGTENKIDYMNTAPTHLGAENTAYQYNSTTKKYEEITVSGANITGSVYGGGNQADVTGNTYVNVGAKEIEDESHNMVYQAVTLQEGSTGVSISENVFGGGKGIASDVTKALVSVNTNVHVGNGTILKSVYGGGELSQVGGDTDVNILGGTIGTSGINSETGNPYGGETYGNVYGGGKGNTTNVEAGLIKGNTSIDVSNGNILHNIYGGGSYGSVGTFTYADADNPSLPVSCTNETGTANITITGGTIGTDGKENGMVFGSSRGNVAAPGEIHDKLAWVHDTHVIIGDSESSTDTTTPLIKGSVYGSGENGHTYQNTKVEVHSGKIGIDATNDPDGGPNYAYRGNVYGGGCGTDKYYVGDGEGQLYNPLAGIVQGDAEVIVDGGLVVHNVYGAGAMGSVGTITNFDDLDTQYKHVNTKADGAIYDFGLSWPYEMRYSTTNPTGLTKVTITGDAIIGVSGSTGGHVFGAARGAVDVGENNITEQRYVEAKLANVREAQVIIGTETGTATTTTPTIHGSVYGGAEDGHVNEDASVTIHHGTIAHSVFGGGKGESTYTTTLWDPDKVNETNKDKDSPESVHSWTAGKVYGNTYVTMNGGSVGYSIYGGGNMASVGKGNYAGGTDDYSTDGYGELPPSSAQTLWDNTNFTGSGIATVTINAGTVGSASTTNQGLPTGNVFGSSRGKAAMSVGQLSPRYRYVPDFFLGYVNKTVITIGGETPSNEADAEPIIHGSVYGGGQDGHVRNSTHVIINKGSIGSADGGTDRGNVFGAGSGLGQYTKGSDSYYNNSSGSVTCTTQVDINGGKIFQNVYGGGALSSVGPPFTGQAIGIETNAATDSKSSYSYTQVNINGGTIGTENSDYGGNVYGASRGSITINYQGEDPNTYATDLWSTVNIGETSSSVPTVIWGNVFGGGENGQVKGSVTVTMTGGEVKNDVYGGGALAHTNTSNWVYNRQTASTAGSWGDTWAENMTTTVNGKIATKYNTLVSLTGGRIYGDAYGGALGKACSAVYHNDSIPAYVFGDVTVKLNEGKDEDEKGCIVNRIFGCNNLSGTPMGHVQVYVYATQNADDEHNTISLKYPIPTGNNNVTESVYDVAAVYGGGNLSPYEPADAFLDYSSNKARVDAARSEVYIDGCDWTSIQQVYGGGNAAATPATFVQVNRCYEIDEVFGGGNGFDSYTLNNDMFDNPGANVGYKNYTHFVSSGSKYVPVENTDADTKEKRMNNPTYRYGSGIATTEIRGGKIHTVYGGSNKKGNISTTALSMYAGMFSDCPMDVDQSYGGGKDADIDGEVIMQLNCAKGIKEMFGGSKNADVDNDISLTVTNGSSLERVFGGNNTSGAINGSITVNIEEGGCEPVIINELYLGGYLAPYSVYGYQQTNGVYDYIDKTDEEGNAIQERIPLTSGDNPKKDPRINVISATRIDNIYGGGYKAKVVGNPHINVNMKPGRVNVDPVEESGTVVYKDINDNTYSGDNLISVEENGKTKYYGILPLGSVGNIYGGGNEADIVGNTYVEIGTGMWLNGDDVWETADAQGNKYTYKKDASNEWHWYNASDAVVTAPTPARKAAVIRSDTRNEVVYEGGNVYGGGNKGDITGNTYVNICAYEEDDASTTDVIEYKGIPLSGTGNEIVTIAGNVFGGGKGIADSFTCAKGMVGEVDSNNGDIVITKESINKGTRVSIGNGTIGGSVYGGGEVGRVEWNGVVTIGLPVGQNETSEPVIQGDVFGGGKGVEQYGYAALLRGNTFVTVQANAKVGKSVYGGGEIASVGRYYIKKRTDDPTYDPNAPAAPDWLDYGMPYSLANQGSGYCNVIVTGNAEIGPDNMKMYHDDGKAPEDEGHVFGAGKGVLPYENEAVFDDCPLHPGQKHPGRMGPGNVWDCYDGKEADYLTFIETQALATQTEVLVDGNAFVKGSVYGGSLSGHVQHNTHVTIDGDCQIGVGYDTSTGEYQPKYTNWPTETQGITESWAECAHWTYDATDNAPYDPYAKYPKTVDGKVKYYYDVDCTEYANGGSHIATDGHTYYGNVFGGGSGVVPYGAGKWHREAGTVGGNTVVDITGGHILTSVYGGNEHTDVGTYDRSNNNRTLLAGTGKCTINMVGGTVGVPRTKNDITDHPVTCYVFGGGKGDSRVNFNKWTNVGETEVNISGNARIYGSTFGGGEDGHVLGDAETNIGGTVTIGGTVHDYPTVNANPGVIIGTQGLSGADGNVFGGGRGFSEDALTAGVVCGNVRLNIHNGKMLGTVYGGGRLASVGTHLADAGTALYGKLIPEGYNQVIGSTDVAATGASHGIIQINIDGGTIGATDAQTGKLLSSDYSIGDVFGGCKGSGNNKHFGLAKRTEINMTAGTVNGNVYGGGELGYVGEATYNETTKVYEWNEETADGGLCTVGISGGTVAGNVFGAGKGLADDFDCEKALVRTTSVTINKSGATGTTVGGNVYGGGEVGRVDQNTVVTIGNSVGESGGTDAVISGNVFGAGAGVETHGYSALVRGNATVTIQGNASVGQNVYGGGMIASVGQYGLDSNFMPETLKGGGDCRVTVKGYAVIGESGEGHVFGAGKGVNPFDDDHDDIDYTDPTDRTTKPKRMTKRPAADKMPALWDPVGDGSEYIWEYYTSQDNYFKFLQTLALATDSYATIDGNATVKGNVYGGSESGFVQRETDVKIQGSGKILTVTDTNTNTTTDGNVFGGGRGVSGFDLAGRVRGNAKTTISGSSTVNGNVYGGGELGFVGKFTVSANGRNYDWQKITKQDGNEEETGTCTVLVNSASAEVKGDVFGAGKGEAITFKCEPAMTRTTSVSVNAGTVDGNVYGGGEVGRVDENTVVTIGAATGESAPDIKGSVFGAGAGLGTHGYSALVRGNTYVTVQNHATVGHTVYGGGEIASVGKYGLDDQKMPSVLLGGGYCYVTVKDYAKIAKDVFGAGQGITPAFDNTNADRSKRSRRMTMYSSTDFPANAMISATTGEAPDTTTQGTTWEYYESGSPYVWEYFQEESKYLTYLETLALATHPEVTIAGDASIGEDVYGGGERGITKGSVIVNINGGTIARDVYGGGALANTNTTSTVGQEDYNTGVITTETVKPKTTVNLHGGTIGHNVYGGGLGQKYKAAVNAAPAQGTEGQEPAVEAQDEVPAIAALVYGDVLVKLNETTATDNCVVKGVVHGANNYNGSPLSDVTVHVYKTQGWEGHTVDKSDPDATRTNTVYELKAVYGGGNEATYDPVESADEKHKAHVIIDGCDLTSIETVYGGGNAASAPETYVEVNSCYEIGTVFGGGNGKDKLGDGSDNPGAHVGYKADGTTPYGTGVALAELKGGTIHKAFGGSNTLGNVRTSATVTLNEPEGNTCPLCIEEVYGAGNEAAQDGTSNINLGCLSYLKEIYGGAKNADIDNDIELTIQSGRFDRVFGGNNLGGDIKGTITVNIEETGCHPIIIGQLFGGGNKAGYSVEKINKNRVDLDFTNEAANNYYKNFPKVNVKSFTSIGEIYGGGYGAAAVIVGNPHVIINECVGDNADVGITKDYEDEQGNTIQISEWTGRWFNIDTGDNDTHTVWQPEHKAGAIGTIGNVFGGGNQAGVNGNTNVIIGTESTVLFKTPATKTVTETVDGNEVTTVVATTDAERTHTVVGANITGNVYGGGNAADVSGDTNVLIGK